MRTRQIVAATLLASLAGGVSTHPLAAASTVAMSGTAKDEAKKPFPDYSARAREVDRGQVARTTALDDKGSFLLGNVEPTKYVIELIDKDGKVVCTEGPFDMTRQAVKNDIVVDCDRVPAAWWLLGAAAGAGITAGVVAAGPASAAN